MESIKLKTMSKRMNRRQALAATGLLTGSTLLPVSAWNREALQPAATPFRHSVCRWCFSDVPLEILIREVKECGIDSIELLKPDEWPSVYQEGLTCAVATDNFISLTKGFNAPEQHERLQSYYPTLMEQAADQGIPHVICFSGNRNDLGREEGLENCARGLDVLVKKAESLGITLIMELLNSRVDHPDYQCDHTEWGVALVEKIGSPHFKLLYDIYHMQVMEGDIIATVRKYGDHIAHYHTAGVPGRHEIDETQELYYPAIMRAIADTGFTGYVGQEFIPSEKETQFAALRDAVIRCSL